MNSQKHEPLVWSDHDAAVWHACDIAAGVIRGSLAHRPRIAAPFPAGLDPTEQMLANGPFNMLTYRPGGDGTYRHNGGFFLATGAAGLALSAGLAVTRAIGNTSRRAEATAAATPRWRPEANGDLWVSSHGFYLQTVHGLFPWAWRAVGSASMVGPAEVHLQGNGQDGATSWIIKSPWSELLFVLWALAVHPAHPQLLTAGWLPPGWLDRCDANGFRPRNQLHTLSGNRGGVQ